jgi:hypothetical protein
MYKKITRLALAGKWAPVDFPVLLARLCLDISAESANQPNPQAVFCRTLLRLSNDTRFWQRVIMDIP